jgi:hypothetical protein
MTRPRTDDRRAIIQRANQIKLQQRRVFPGHIGFPSTLFSMRQVQQAVCLVRRRGSVKDQELLTAAGYNPRR